MDAAIQDIPIPVPADVCGYPVERVLTGGQSYLASGPSGRAVVLKRLDEDCLLRGDLHPSIRERLSRVRELAHGGVANLHGVSREGQSAFLIWEFVPGQTLEEYAADPVRTPRDLLLLARELITSVDALHMQGIIHGAVIPSNVIITDDASVRLTHVSPLLYTDLAVDVECVLALLEHASAAGPAGASLARLLDGVDRANVSLRVLGSKVAVLLESREEPAAPAARGDERRIRRRTLLAAGIIALLAIVIGYGIWRATDGRSDLRASFPWAQTPDAPR